MTPLPTTTPPVREIAVLRALALGDLLCAIPVLRVLRARHPGARVTLIGLPGAREVVRRFPHLVDELWPFPGFPSIPEVPLDPAATTAFLLAAQGRKFDLAVGLQGSGLASNAFLALLGARDVVGFMPPGIGTPPGPGTWLPHDPHGSEIRRLLRISPALGGVEPDSPPDERLELPALPGDDAELRLVRGTERVLAAAYAVVHPGAADPRRRWPAERFAAVARGLVERGLRVAITGSAAERDVAAAVAAAAAPDVVDLAGRTTLGALAALVGGARLVVTNDTGVSHVAAARRTPSVVVFTASERERWAPLDGDLHVAIGEGMQGACSHDEAAPHRCLGDSCTRRDACSREASRRGLAMALRDGEPPAVDAVVAGVDRLLSRDRIHAG